MLPGDAPGPGQSLPFSFVSSSPYEMTYSCTSNCGMWIDDVAMLLLFVGVVAGWWATKHAAIEFDRPGLWDGADLAFGCVAAVAIFGLQLGVVAYEPTVMMGTPVWLIALRSAAITVWQVPLILWFLSVIIEKETKIRVPASLEPIEDRVWNRQLCWVPLEDPRET